MGKCFKEIYFILANLRNSKKYQNIDIHTLSEYIKLNFLQKNIIFIQSQHLKGYIINKKPNYFYKLIKRKLL